MLHPHEDRVKGTEKERALVITYMDMDMVSSDEPREFIELMWGIPSEFNQFGERTKMEFWHR